MRYQDLFLTLRWVIALGIITFTTTCQCKHLQMEHILLSSSSTDSMTLAKFNGELNNTTNITPAQQLLLRSEDQNSIDVTFLKQLLKKSQYKPIIPLTLEQTHTHLHPVIRGFSEQLIQPPVARLSEIFDDSNEIKAITAMVKGYGWYEIIFLYEDSESCHTFASKLIDAFRNNEIRISNKICISSFIEDFEISKMFSNLMNTQTKIVLVHLTPALGSRLFSVAKEVGMMRQGFAWLITSNMSRMLSSMETKPINAMEGVLGSRPHLDESSVIEIVNVIGKGERIVGYWTPEFGLIRDLGSMNTRVTCSNSVKHFKNIIWPGDSALVPSSCDVPKVLRLGGLWGR